MKQLLTGIGVKFPISAVGSNGRCNTFQSVDPTALLLEIPATLDPNLDRAVFCLNSNGFGSWKIYKLASFLVLRRPIETAPQTGHVLFRDPTFPVSAFTRHNPKRWVI